MKKINLLLLSVFLMLLSNLTFGQMGGLGQIKEQLDVLGGKITKPQALQLVDGLYKEKILNKEGKRIFDEYIINKTVPELFEKNMKEDSAKSAALGIYKSLLKGADSLLMNRATFLVLLGVIDLNKMSVEVQSAMKKPTPKLKPIVGETWNFSPIADGNLENPLSYQVDMNVYRPDYLRLLNAANKAGLLDPKVFEDAKKWLEREHIIIMKDFSVFLYAAMRSVYYDSYEALKKGQIKKIDTLQTLSLINNEQHKALTNSLTNYQLLRKTEIFKELPNALIFRVNEIEVSKKKAILERLFEQVSRIMPELKISQIEIKEIEVPATQNATNPLLSGMLKEADKFLDRHLLEVSADFNGKRYIKQIPFNQIAEDAIPDVELKNMLNNLINSSWLGSKDVQILNDYLTDMGSDKRLFVVGDEFSIFPSPNREQKVVVLLDENQSKMFTKLFFSTMFSFSGQDFEGQNSLSAFQEMAKKWLIVKSLSLLK